jgi:hypothetical protein
MKIMKFRIYTYNAITNERVLHTAYTSHEAQAKFNKLVQSGNYQKVEMWLGGYSPIRQWVA